jgi:arylsulfatase A-like enzyme
MDSPNVVFILADDLGYGDLGCFNHGLTQTPHLDHLVSQSLCCSQHYAASPVCNPSRAALLTGRYPHRTGSIDTLEWRGLERLALSETTLADVVRAAGYRTGLIGKWHLGAFDPRYHPLRRGFDETVCFRGGMHDYYQWRLDWQDTVKTTDGRYLTDVFTDEAVDFIRRHRQEPFFLHLTYNAPHTPLQAPPEDLAVFADRPDLTPGVRTLYAMIRRLDTGVGRVLETLETCGLTDNTLVVFTSDNGPQFGGRGAEKLDRFNCGLRGAKCQVYEGGIRVPLLLRWPSRLQPRDEDSTLIHGIDLFPTLLRALGITPPRDLQLDGVDLWPTLSTGSDYAPAPRFWQWNRYTPVPQCNAAMRDGNWKLVYPAIPEAMTVPDIHWLEVSMYRPEHFCEHGLVSDPLPERVLSPPRAPQLFNLREDPGEHTDRAPHEPDRVRCMAAQLQNWFDEVEAERRSAQGN